MPPAQLLSSAANVTVRVQPTVLLNICDAYIRRSESQERVVGTLLGTIEGNIVEVKECYAVPFNESQEQVRLTCKNELHVCRAATCKSSHLQCLKACRCCKFVYWPLTSLPFHRSLWTSTTIRACLAFIRK